MANWCSSVALQTEDLVIVCVCVSVLLEYCDWA